MDRIIKKNKHFSTPKYFWVVVLLCIGFLGYAQEQDSLRFPFNEQSGGLYLESPLTYESEYDPTTGNYILYQKMGDTTVGAPVVLTQDEYMQMLLSEGMSQYYKEKSQAYDTEYRNYRYGEEGEKQESSGLILPSFEIKSGAFESIFGGNKIELIPRGYASLDLGVFIQKLDNPSILPQNRNTFAIDLQQRIQMSVLGKVGENLQLEANYDTQAGFGFENRMNLAWRPNGEGGEDNIIKNIEFGNVSMPLSTSLITGAQSLFGVKGEFQFGKTYITTLFSQQQSEAKNVTVENGGVINTFKVYAKDYEANQHYFIDKYFRDNYDEALANYPTIKSLINISNLQVWVVNTGNSNQEDRRAVVAIRDLGDTTALPTNGTLYNQLSSLSGIRDSNTAENAIESAGLTDANGNPYQMGEHYMVHENMRLLSGNEYQFYPELGYVSLNQPLNDNEMLAVSFQYTTTDNPGQVRKVGEFSNEQSELMIVKLLKSNATVDTESPMWDLMMKNIYSLESSQISPEDFTLNILYQDPEIGSGALNYLQNSGNNQPLLQLLNMDRLDGNGSVQENGSVEGDGLFDYVEGITVDSENGRIVFTTIEPFAQTIKDALGDSNSEYAIDNLYDELPINFDQNPEAERYFLEGRYKSSSGEGIFLGAFNIPQGSVTVTANGQTLTEGADYIVDYSSGRVTIINQTLKDSGTPINISLENQSTFNLQKKRLLGLNVEHRFSNDFIIGGTLMNYAERPLTQKAQFGYEPVSNTIVGANILYNKESEWLTRLTDKIPLVDTEVPSQINFNAEAAYLMPGVNDATDNQSYIDDFEDSQSEISLFDASSWSLASTPLSTTSVPNQDFPSTLFDSEDLSYNYFRRGISWYNIDPRFWGIGGSTSLSSSEVSNHASRRVRVKDIYPNQDLTAGNASYLTTFDVSYYPEERGPYNLNPNWQNETKDDKWAGLMRPLNVTNLTQYNVEYVEFWIMDPYADGQNDSQEAKLLMHLGNVSEDVLRDGNMTYENGLNNEQNTPDTTIWGEQPSDYPILYSFDTEGDARRQQDVGYDGLIDAAETTYPGYDSFATATNPITNELDPAADNFVFYLSEVWDDSPEGGFVPNRYKYFRGLENNAESNTTEVATTLPDSEDANKDYNLDRIENYNQYTIPLAKSDLNNDNPFIVDSRTINVTFENGQTDQETWYLFRVPIDDYDLDNGAASESVLTSARYMRMIVKGFEEQTTLRFGSLNMVRSDWNKYDYNIFPDTIFEEGGEEVDNSNLSIGTVNIEENGSASPPYVLPPDINREEIQTNTGLQSQNEASMVIEVNDLDPKNARGVYKKTNLDLRRYKVLKMNTHVHSNNQLPNDEGSLRMFIRIGSDLSDNYYEYEFPMEYTATTATSATQIWPDANFVEVDTDLFVEAKKEAYAINSNDRYTYIVDDENEKFIYVKGRPSLGSVSKLMIGVRNTGRGTINEATVWVNELRLSEIDNEGGYAATANLNVTLGDFAQINTSGNISTIGFGALDAGPSNRQQEEMKNYTVNAAVNLDKFLPEKWGLKIPFNYIIAEQFIDPKYNPLDNDVEIEDVDNKDEILDIARTYSKQTTFAFNNVRKERVRSNKQHFYDVENFSVSFLYNSDYYRDIYLKYNIEKRLRASLNYNYNFKKKTIQPFKEWRMVHDTAQSARYLQWVKEFNFNPIPSRLSFNTDIVRTYTEQQYRNVNSYLNSDLTSVAYTPTFSDSFLFNWQYNVGYDLSKSLRVDYTAATKTLNDFQAVSADQGMIFQNLFSIGRPINYNHQLSINWKTPLRLFPYMEWVDVDLGYTTQYDWQAQLANQVEVEGEDVDLGNMAQNAQTWSAIGNLNFEQFYTNFKGFRRVDSIRQARNKELDSITRSFEQLAKNKRGLKKIKKSKIKYKTKYQPTDYLLMAISSIKRGQFNYTRTSGIVLPGVLAEPSFFGTGKSGGGPNTSFVFGSQFDVRRMAVENNWVTDSEYLTNEYMAQKNTTFTANLNIQPSPSLQIDLNARRNFTRNLRQSGFNTTLPDGTLGLDNAYANNTENFTTSTISLNTAFKDTDALFQNLVENAQTISMARGAQYGLTDTDGDGFAQGYGITNADVLVPAFLATYRGQNASDSDYNYKTSIPIPNWNIVYTGLQNIPFLKKRLNKIEVTHAYNSSYTVSGVQSNLNQYAFPTSFNPDGTIQVGADGNPVSGLDGNGDLYAFNTYGSVSLVESFEPLIGVDMTFRNSLQLRAVYNKNRIVSMSLANYTLTEEQGDEFILGLGYIWKDVKMSMRYMGKKKTLKGDVNLRADFSLTDSETQIRYINNSDSQVTGGQNIFALKINAQYNLSRNFSASFYYQQNITKYKISTAFPISAIRAGINLTFTLGE